MIRVESFYLKWMRRGELIDPDKWRGSPKWEDYTHDCRILSVVIWYFGAGEYVDPITRKAVESPVVDVVEKEREASRKGWKPRKRIEVRRQVWFPTNPGDRWSPVDKYNTLRQHRAQVYQECKYNFMGKDRSRWFPEYLSFPIISDPMILYIRRADDLDRLWLATLRHLSFNRSDEDAGKPLLIQTLPNERDWSYPGLTEGEKPPEWIDAVPRRVNFFPEPGKRKVTPVVMTDGNRVIMGVQKRMRFRRIK